MNFYEYFYCIMINFLQLYIKEITAIGNNDLDVTERGVHTATPCSVGLVLFANVNNTSGYVDYDVEVTPDQCCLDKGSEDDCDAMEIVGECVDTIPKGTTKTLKLVAPLLDPLERRGFCTVYLNSKPNDGQRKAMRDIIKIPFDTRIKNTQKTRSIFGNISVCNDVDEDPLNDCKPVDCETYYNGKRPFYESKTKRCVNVPLCISNVKDEVPNVIYDMNKNKCIIDESISQDDLKLIKELTSNVKDRTTKDILIIKNLKKPKPSMKTGFGNNYLKSLECKHSYGKQNGYQYFLTKYLTVNKWTLMVLAIVVLVQCILICSMIFCLTKSCKKSKKNKIVRQFFNCRKDASVTTPLIYTSNIDTETTDYQYFSDSCNIENKIKCYKACQKEGQYKARISVSDDILSKCLTRRDWNRNPVRSEVIPESIQPIENRDITKTIVKEDDQPTSIAYHTSDEQPKRSSNVKVNFENEKAKPKEKKQNNLIKSIVKKFDKQSNESKDYEKFQGELSEKEIKCHSYTHFDGESNVTGFKPSKYCKKLGFFKSDKNKSGAVSMSTEKGAQATFSNDSIDDFLSERGMMLLADNDLSKYSFASRSNDINGSSVSSEISSKTSKNNVIKNVLSLIHRRSKHCSSSDPGSKKPDSNLNLELIHLSHASIYSSSYNETYLQSLPRNKDSRTSL